MSSSLGLKINPVNGQQDIYFVDGQLAFVTDADYVAQRIQTRLLTQLGEWFLDTSIGVDWYGSIFVKPVNLVLVEAILKQTIINTPDVNALLSFESDFEVDTRQYNVVFTVDTVYGPVDGGLSNG